MSKLPLDASDKRLHKMYQLAEYCASFPDGCSETQMIRFAKRFGNIVPTIMRLLADMGVSGVDLVTRLGNMYYVTNTNYISWGEAKGFRDIVYNTKCTGCSILYASNLKECPQCHETNKLLNEPGGYTHTPVLSQTGLDEIPEITTEQYTHTHKKTNSEEFLPREERVIEGRRAEKRVVELLGKFGSAKLGVGRGGKPDVFFTSKRGSYCVEVKSVESMVRSNGDNVNGYKVGCVPLSRNQWVSLSGFAEVNGMVPLMIVEVKVNGAKNVYHFIPREVVDHKIKTTESKHIRISVHDLPMMSIHSFREGVPLLGVFQL